MYMHIHMQTQTRTLAQAAAAASAAPAVAAPAGPPPPNEAEATEVVVLSNLFSETEIKDTEEATDILDDTKEKCGEYGGMHAPCAGSAASPLRAARLLLSAQQLPAQCLRAVCFSCCLPPRCCVVPAPATASGEEGPSAANPSAMV